MSEHLEAPHRHEEEAIRSIGGYALYGAVDGPEMIDTPAGRMPIGELSALFYTQIAPSSYFPQIARAEDAVDTAVIADRTLRINGQNIEVGSDNTLFVLNVLMALRNVPEIRGADSLTLGMTYYDTANTKVQSAWDKSVDRLMDEINGAARAPLLEKTTLNKRNMYYSVSPRLNLVDERPAHSLPEESFEQTLYTRLLALQDPHHITVPYADATQELTITTNRQVERDDQAWILSGNERHLFNLVRLAGGLPLLAPEIITAGFSVNSSTDRAKRDAIRNAARSLNDSVLDDGSGRAALVIDATDTMLLRLTRNVVVRDTRHMRTPSQANGDDQILTRRLRAVLNQHREARDDRRDYGRTEGVQPRPPATELINFVHQHAPDAFLQQKIGLRDMYLLSLRTGMYVPFLAGTVLPRTDGKRVAYDDLEATIRSGPAPIAQISETLSISPPFCPALIAKTVQKLRAAGSAA